MKRNNEITHVLSHIDDPFVMDRYIKGMTQNQLSVLQEHLLFTPKRIQLKWDDVISSSLDINKTELQKALDRIMEWHNKNPKKVEVTQEFYDSMIADFGLLYENRKPETWRGIPIFINPDLKQPFKFLYF